MKSSINNQARSFHQGHHLLIIEAGYNNLQPASAQHVNQSDDLNVFIALGDGYQCRLRWSHQQHAKA
jgi:hypothetical protein